MLFSVCLWEIFQSWWNCLKSFVKTVFYVSRWTLGTEMFMFWRIVSFKFFYWISMKSFWLSAKHFGRVFHNCILPIHRNLFGLWIVSKRDRISVTHQRNLHILHKQLHLEWMISFQQIKWRKIALGRASTWTFQNDAPYYGKIIFFMRNHFVRKFSYHCKIRKTLIFRKNTLVEVKRRRIQESKIFS